MELSIGSLCAGIGGIDLGFAQAGFSIAWAIERDKDCCKTYRYNFPAVDLIEQDIRNVNLKELRYVDVITAGFPCQPFSIAGKQLGFQDERGNIFQEIMRFVDAMHPAVIFLENVSNLIEHDGGRTFNIIHNSLIERGYYIRYRILRASEYGSVPQIRDRIYIIAFKSIVKCDCFLFPERKLLSASIEDVLKRCDKKHKAYYYPKDDPFYCKIENIVTNKNVIYRVYHESVKITQNKMCPTLTASMGTKKNQTPLVCDDYGIRRLTISECLSFQGFPADFKFPNTITLEAAYKEIGNSVCVPIVKDLADRILNTYKCHL